jgi:23S rRNA G2069 N7-methylase RlmK/C1962 C5-methylase RlmI
VKGVRTDIIQGDCLEVLRSFPDDTFDLIITSPPYADQRKNTYGGIRPEDYVGWFIPRSAELLRVLKPSGIIEPLGHRAKERNDFFQTQYELVVDAFTQDFRRDFCDPTNNVLWEKLAQFTSAEVPPMLSRKLKS